MVSASADKKDRPQLSYDNGRPFGALLFSQPAIIFSASDLEIAGTAQGFGCVGLNEVEDFGSARQNFAAQRHFKCSFRWCLLLM